ncbi:hypothetical protein ABZT16_09650 [Streptomyces flaveolus]|uniref:Uncharacterized protein n=1 Tax=Streptomyces flaveolus TaxID=67297 RepID=A0ABV3ACK4_9ACTN|nr:MULTISPECIES: hypothetical protein [unclassified Streptomyces]MBG7699517.1 hypothetical protein [Streptomyces sp. MC1]
MAEFTLSTASGDDWPVLPRADFPAVLHPRSFECHAIEGESDHSFRTGDAMVSASWELAGTWYVSVDGAPDPDAADAIVAEMAQQLGEATGKTATWYRITD